jgi:glycosyltransferase involved in cell wall biosynthesis
MTIIIFGDLFNFPEGHAATNRIYTYAKGLMENGIRVQVICFSNDYLPQPDGVAEGIIYYNAFNRVSRSPSFFARRWHKLRKYFRTYQLIRKIRREDSILAINRWSDIPFTQFYCWVLSRLFNIKIITECNEHPLRYHQEGAWRKWSGNLRFRLDAFFSDGILCISDYLVKFHLDRGIKQQKLFLLPSTVDPTRFKQIGQRPVDEFYIGYFGSLTFRRDDIGVLLDAFSILHKQGKPARLVLGGFCTDEERQRIRTRIGELGITDNVMLVEYLSRNEILRYIGHADILVMVRARDLESDASYPSKLTEFLASGRPVLSVNVGEVSSYLTDAVNAYLVPPGDAAAMAARLIYMTDHYNEAVEVGKRGKELTDGVFNYNFQAKRLIGYAKSLKS